MSQERNMITVEVTTRIRVAPDEERQRLSSRFKGPSLERLLALVNHVEAGNFYEGAKLYFQECTYVEREAVGIGMASIFEGIGSREVDKKLWAERDPGVMFVSSEGRMLDGTGLDYPRYALAGTAPGVEQTVTVGQGDGLEP